MRYRRIPTCEECGVEYERDGDESGERWFHPAAGCLEPCPGCGQEVGEECWCEDAPDGAIVLRREDR